MEGNRLRVVADMPGFRPEDVGVTVQNGQLVISGRRPLETGAEGRSYLLRERAGFRFERRFNLPEGVDADKVRASYQDGLLEVTLELAESALPRKAPIKVGGGGRKRLAA